MKRVAVTAAMVVLVGLAHAERLRAPDGTIREVPDMSVEYALKGGYQRLSKVRMRKPDNTTVDVDEDLVDGVLRTGYWKMTAAEVTDDDQMRKRTAEAEADMLRIEADAAAAWKAEHSGGPVNCHGKVAYVSEEDMSHYLAGGDCVRVSDAEAGRLQTVIKDEPRNWRPTDETIVLCGVVGLVVALLIRWRLRAP